MRIVDGMPVFTEAEQDLIWAAEDDMTIIKQIKEDFFALADAIKAKANLMTGTEKYLGAGDYEDGIIAMEEALDDMLLDAWRDATERAHSSESLPQSKVYISYLNNLRAKEKAEISDKFDKVQFPDITKFLKG